jgi:O-methyltransferase involved in polyketide biosynthesis
MSKEDFNPKLSPTNQPPTTKLEDKENFKNVEWTAHILTFIRNFANLPYSQEMNKISGTKDVPDDLKKMLMEIMRFKLVHGEERFVSISEILEQMNIKNVLELASGFSTMGTDMQTKNPQVHYIETDMEPNLSKKKKALEELKQMHPEIRLPELKEVNVLNFEQLKKAADLFTPEEITEGIVIIVAGLLPYLDCQNNHEQKRIALANIRNILLEKNGILITPDISTKKSYRETFEGHPEEFEKFFDLMKEMTGKDLYANCFEDLAEQIKFFEDNGLKVVHLPHTRIADKLVSPNKLNISKEETDNELKKNFTLILMPKA